MSNNLEPQLKLARGALLSSLCLVASNALAGLNAAEVLPNPPASVSPNILYAMYGQVFNNPSSLFVIGFLCVVCWLADDLPWINSKYVVHISVIIGASTFWMFTSVDAVPKYFPHPQAVLVVEGILCGFAAFVIHRQAIARLIDFAQAKAGNQIPQNQNQNKPS